MRTKGKITAYIPRGAGAALLASCVIVAFSSALSLPNKGPKVLIAENGAVSGVNGRESVSSAADSAIQKERTLTFAHRVAYQQAIEEVYWRHRIWPKENAGPKPPLDEVMSHADVERKVEDYLRNTKALEDSQRPITTEQLQDEMGRMVQHSKQPKVLRELFHALGDDPFVIAECLARPVLAEPVIASLTPHYNNLEKHFESGRAKAAKPMSIRTAFSNASYMLPSLCTDDTWTATGTSNAPTGRFSHGAVWTGSEMIVWGGYSGNQGFNTGGRYSPATDSWTDTSTVGAPLADGHAAVWTGSEMIVWGGGGSNAGGRYNPGTNTWTATSTTNAPSGRSANVAVWTGSEMIVWGGVDGFGNPLNTGGKYNPSTNSWTATSTTNAPTARTFHTAVWTGGEMIIWGGWDVVPGDILNTGGRYNPATDSWTATSISNAPSPRAQHTAVWTGSEMIAWGGSLIDGSPPFNTGGRYNPSTDSWIGTSTNNAPSGRLRHTAVWTGTEMIAWAGFTTSAPTNTGGRYNPNTDSWTATSTINAPDARYDHTAIWTGSEMIVWGGEQTYPNGLNTGGRYCAQSAPTPSPTATATATSSATLSATPTATTTPISTTTATTTPTPTPTECTGRCSPTPRPHPTSAGRPTPPPRLTPPPAASPSVTPAPRPTPPPRLTPPPSPTGSPRPTPAPRP